MADVMAVAAPCNSFALITSCQGPHDHVIALCNVSSFLAKSMGKLSGKLQTSAICQEDS